MGLRKDKSQDSASLSGYARETWNELLELSKRDDLTGTGQKTISRIENGKVGTRLETIFRLLATLDLEMKLTARGKGSEKSIGDIF